MARDLCGKADLTKGELVRRLKSFAKSLKRKSVSYVRFRQETGLSSHRLAHHFASWNELVVAAGLQPIHKKPISDDELYLAMKEGFVRAGGVCSQNRFNKLCRFDVSVYRRRGWGGWRKVLVRFRQWAEIYAPDFPYLQNLPVAADLDANLPNDPTAATWAHRGGRRFGALLNFRGLMHSPLNESGVVFLFGMVAQELGYVIESLTSGFPDCEAKRRIGKGEGNWERIRVEFEYESRNFVTHGHPAGECDVIVCWEHNWPDCPLEVLELKTAIRSLAG